MHHYRQVLMRMRQGDSDRDIGRSRLMSRKKAASLRSLAQEQGWLEPERILPDDATIMAAIGAAKRASSTVSSLEPLRDQIAAWHEQGVSGVVIHAALKRDHGFTGSYSSVRRILGTLKRAQAPDTTVRLSFTPREAAQVDFGAGPMLRHPSGEMRRTWAFVMTLCFSRHQYVEFVWDQTVATWLGCHRRAFEWFNGVPERLIIDNAKCAIIKACRFDPEVQRSYAECAEGYGFKIDPCPPHDPQKKGIVESGVKYVKRNFLPTRSFRDLSDLNTQVRTWVLHEAGQRTHGTTRQSPLALFETEHDFLKALPSQAPDLGVWRRVSVHRDCHIKFEYALYSVPFALVGKALWLRATDNCVALYEDFRLVATHARAKRKGQRMTTPDHLPPQAQAFLSRDRQWLNEQAQAIGSHCQQVIECLLGDHILERLRAAQGIIGLAQTYGAARLENACQRALAHDSPAYRTVKSILQSNADRVPPQTPVQAVYTQARFARKATTLFNPQPDTLH